MCLEIWGAEQWEEDQLEDFTSVLDLAKASGQVPSVPLQWHYRSQHEDLITFSNYSFYGGRLLTFPSAHADGGDLGVELIRVDGVYRRGGARDNPIEAAAVVGRVLHHLRQSPGRTIGVVAFSDAQANAIEAALELKAKDVPELRGIISDDRLDGFFVKNLESVQGDDRDIIIFSVGYGPDENGRLSLNFGPINRKGGERRLNVAITRARRRLEVISSVSAEDIGMDVASEGMKHLRRYLDFAARPANRIQAIAPELGPSGLDVESPFEDEVVRVIRSWGFSVVPQVGCADYRIDLGVLRPGHPGQYVLGVECDGAAYHSSKAARDRDRLRQEMLTRLGWSQLYRIWGPAWYRKRSQEEAKLRTAIESAIASADAAVSEPPRPSPAFSSNPGVKVIRDDVELNDSIEWAKPYRVCKLQPRKGGRAFDDPAANPYLQRLIVEVLGVEAPMAYETLLRRVREAWGLARAGSRVRAAFDLALRRVLQGGEFVRDGEFLNASRQGESTVRTAVQGEPETFRSVSELPLSELALAMTLIVRDARRIRSDELTARTSRLFGWNRRGHEIGETLDDVLQSLISHGQLRADGEYLAASA